MIAEIQDYLSQIDLDVRKTGDARFMDQKVTPDVVCIIADCVLQFVGDNLNKEFTTKDIWNSQYANENIKDIFNKPDVLSETARSEYDKFFAQPLKMLAYGHILNCERKGNKNIFTIQNREILSYISIKEKNALNFLVIYLEKVLRDSDIWHLFDGFFNESNNTNFHSLKDGFRKFLYKYTSINDSNHYEPGRIFTKIINPLAYYMKSLGTKGGNLSADIIGYDELMYNRKNRRDIQKLRDETRQDYEMRAKQEVEKTRNAFVKFTIEKAKRLIRERCHDVSEINDEFANGQATQVHHIFSRYEFPQIESYLENLILLTATQHSTKAHPDNNTRRMNKEYQLLCLLSKSASVKQSLSVNDGFYTKEDFIFVLNEGVQPTNKFVVESPFSEIEKQLSDEYHKS